MSSIARKEHEMLFHIINKEEIELLSGMPHFYRLLYIYLRTKVNIKTGMLGDVAGRRISLQAISEWLYVEPAPGIKESGCPSKSKIRTALEVLQKAGLIHSKSIVTKEKKQLIFFLPYVLKYFYTQNKVSTPVAHLSNTGCKPIQNGKTLIKSEEILANEQNPHIEEGTLKNEKVCTPHNNKIIITTTPTNSKCLNLNQSINPNFEPSPKALAKLKQWGLAEFHSSIELEKFISYNLASKKISDDWDSLYLHWLAKAQEFYQRGKKNYAKTNKHTKSSNLSAVDQVRLRNQQAKQRIIDVKAH